MTGRCCHFSFHFGMLPLGYFVRKKTLFILAVITGALICLFWFILTNSNFTSVIINDRLQHEKIPKSLLHHTGFPVQAKMMTTKYSNQTKMILYWTKLFNEKLKYSHQKYAFERNFKHCPVKNCKLTDDRHRIAITMFDAVLFHARDFSSLHIPPYRSPHQRYILHTTEAPPFDNKDFNQPRNFFNWSMTYRLDSDIQILYGKIIPKEKQEKTQSEWKEIKQLAIKNMPNKAKGKTKLVAAFVSNCATPGKREDYVVELQQYIPVDVYGGCGPLKCPKTTPQECNKMLERDYKFFLAFENAVCKDYISEKFFHTLNLNIIPIVRGGGNYSLIAPPHSYIDTNSFQSAKQLAMYLLELNTSDVKYSEYFWWKDHFLSLPHDPWCDFCALLNKDMPSKIYEDFNFWWKGMSNC